MVWRQLGIPVITSQGGGHDPGAVGEVGASEWQLGIPLITRYPRGHRSDHLRGEASRGGRDSGSEHLATGMPEQGDAERPPTATKVCRGFHGSGEISSTSRNR